MWPLFWPLVFLFVEYSASAGVSNHSCAVPVAVDASADDVSALNLVQVMASMDLPFSQPNSEQTRRLNEARPIEWLHVPKTGSTFLNALVQHPSLCPGATSSMIITPDENEALRTFKRHHYVTEVCPGSFFRGDSLGFHHGIGSKYSQLKGRMMMFARDPTGRIISAYNFHQHSWYLHKKAPGIRSYARLMKGQFLKMLVRDYDMGWPNYMISRFFKPTPTAWEVREARRRVEDGFAFIGITEEWELSMCLFHKMFGGPCVKSEFLVCHPAKSDPKELHDQKRALRDWEDPYDGPLYKYTKKLFHQKIKDFDVSAETCGRCWQQAGVSAISTGGEAFFIDH